MSSSGHILIIDDEASLRQTLARILQRAGFEVTTAANGIEGLSLASQHLFDLVYLDIRMPDVSGLELLKTIHTKYPDLPVILFTAQPDLNSAVEALRRGASDYLLKPLKPQAVVDRTQSILADAEKERRKRDLLRQMDTLQAELNALNKEKASQADQATQATPGTDDRFLKRGMLTLDLHTRRVSINSEVINLPPTSFHYLLVLARHSPNVVDFQTLVAEAQGAQAEMHEAQKLTKWHIHQLRQALENNPHNPSRLITVRGIGYRLIAD